LCRYFKSAVAALFVNIKTKMSDNEQRTKIYVFKGDLDEHEPNHVSYKDWRFKLEGKLIGTEMKQEFDNLVENVAQNINANLRKKLAVLYQWILDRLAGEPLQLAQTVENQNAVNIVRVLDRQYNSQGRGQRKLALTALISDKPKVDESLSGFIARKQTMGRDRLKNTVTIDELIELGVLTNLPAEYTHAVTGLLANDAATWAQCKKVLLETETAVKASRPEQQTTTVLQAQAPTSDVEMKDVEMKVDKLTAAIAKMVRSTKGKGAGKGSWKGGSYKRSDNKKGKGWYDAKKSSNKENERKCWNCGHTGHQKSNCPNGQPSSSKRRKH